MRVTHSAVCFFAALAILFTAAPVPAAQQPAASQTLPDKPAADKADVRTSVTVEHDGTDTLGAKLAFHLKGTFNSSSLFTLTDKNEPKIKVLLSTAAEFPSRPGVASVYSVVWAFSQADGTLSFLLARDVGVVTAEELDALAVKLAERTDGLAAKYGYLFSR